MRIFRLLCVVLLVCSCPSLGPLKVACLTDADCPTPLHCAGDGFCAEGGSAGGSGVGGGTSGGGAAGGNAGGTAGGTAGGAAGGAPDAGDGGPPPRFCAMVPASVEFCRDFDDPVPDDTFSTWSDHDTSDSGTVLLDSTTAASPPRSMLSYVTQQNNGCIYARASASLDGGQRHARAGFAVRVAAGTTGNFGSLAFQSFNNGWCQAVLSDTPATHLRVLEQNITQSGTGSTSDDHGTSFNLPNDSWARLELDYNLVARHVLLILDGGVVLDAGFAGSCPWSTTGRIELNLGVYCYDNPPSLQRYWFDDVTLDVQ